MDKNVTVTLGLQNAPGKGPTDPNARIVLSQPNLRRPDGTIREVQPYELKVQHSLHYVDLLILCAALLAAGLLAGRRPY